MQRHLTSTGSILLTGLVSLVAAPSSTAQITPYVRPAEVIATTMGFGYSVATEGELSGALYTDLYPADSAWLQVSDGRGLAWRPRIKLNAPGSLLLTIESSSLQVEGGVFHACWSDVLGGLFYRTVRPEAIGADPIVPLDTGQAAGGDVLGYELALHGDELHALVISSADTAFDHDGDLFLLRSHDGGASFSAAVPVSSADASGADVVSATLSIEGDEVYVLWLDDRNDPGGELDLFLRRSLDGGATWVSPEVRVNALAGGLPDEDPNQRPALHLASDQGQVVTAWHQVVSGSFPEVRSAWSTDHGATFSEQRVGAYPAGTSLAFSSDLRAQAGAFLLAWRDNRDGFLENRFTRSLDGGRTWFPELPLPDVNTASDDRAVLAGEGQLVSAIYDSSIFAGEFVGALSRDGGETWDQAVQFSQPELSRLLPAVVFNGRYSSFLHFWNLAPGGGDNVLHVGGFRPQKVTPLGFQGGDAQVSFLLEGFPPADKSALILVSEAPGGLTLPQDVRKLGLAAGDLLALSLANRSGIFSAILQPDGSGTSAKATVQLSSGQCLYFAAIGLRADGAPGAITDVVPLLVP